MIRLAVLISGSGSLLPVLVERAREGRLDAEIALVITTQPQRPGLERARKLGLPVSVVERRAHPDPHAFNDALHAELDRVSPDLVVCAGFLSRLENRGYAGRVMNVHPALIPAFCGQGFYGARVHRAVLEAGVKLSGATVHFCDDEYDTGPIIAQMAVPVAEDDSPDTLAARVAEAERRLYPEAIQLFAEGRLRIEGRRVRVLPKPS